MEKVRTNRIYLRHHSFGSRSLCSSTFSQVRRFLDHGFPQGAWLDLSHRVGGADTKQGATLN